MIKEKWLKMYKLAKKYYEEHGNLLIPNNYSIKKEGKKINLGAWINSQRCKYKGNVLPKLLDEQIKLLEDIGMVWSVVEYYETNISEEWLEKYDLAKDYYEEHGNLLIPNDYSIKKEGKKINLGAWITGQRLKYKGTLEPKLLDKQIELLEKIGMIWDTKKYRLENMDNTISEEWLEKYELAKEYYEEHGNLLISANYIENVNGKVIKLGDWINTQRKAYKKINNRKINNKQIKLLENIGMVWSVVEYYQTNISEEWLEKYELAKEYYEEHGNLLIPNNYSIIKEGKKINLGYWVSRQRKRYNGNQEAKLSDKQIRLLEKIDIIWDIDKYKSENNNEIISEKWLEKYELAKKYYEEHGNLLISNNYVENINGKVINLGTWINTQRRAYKKVDNTKINVKQIKLLEQIGMVWTVFEYKQIDKYLIQQYVLYEQNMLTENQINKLLEDGVFVYSDSDELQKVDALEYYRRSAYKGGFGDK